MHHHRGNWIYRNWGLDSGISGSDCHHDCDGCQSCERRSRTPQILLLQHVYLRNCNVRVLFHAFWTRVDCNLWLPTIFLCALRGLDLDHSVDHSEPRFQITHCAQTGKLCSHNACTGAHLYAVIDRIQQQCATKTCNLQTRYTALKSLFFCCAGLIAGQDFVTIAAVCGADGIFKYLTL